MFKNMNYAYRIAKPDDAASCLVIRGKTRENAYSEEDLKAIGITVESWSDGIKDGTLPGYVCLQCNTIIGYCFGARDSGEIVVLALLLTHEDRGVGKTILELMISDFKSRGF